MVIEPIPEDIATLLARRADALGAFARFPRYYACVTSTNDVAARLAEAGAPEGAWVLADEQTAGRGRRGHTWASPPGAGLYLSVLFRPDASSAADRAALPLLTLMAGVAVATGVRRATGLAVTLKWPNDVVIEPPGDRRGFSRFRKLAGILAESSGAGPATTGATGAGTGPATRDRPPALVGGGSAAASQPRGSGATAPGAGGATGSEAGGATSAWTGPVAANMPQFVVLGMGINLSPAAYPPDVAARAASIEGELGRVPERALVLVELLAALAEGWRRLRAGEAAGVLRDWRALAPSSEGRRVRWRVGDEPASGVTQGIDESGALCLKTRTGFERLIAGELEWE